MAREEEGGREADQAATHDQNRNSLIIGNCVFERIIHVVYRPFPVNDALVFINWEKYKFQQGELTSPCWMIERVIYQPGIEQSESYLCITLREQQAGKDKRFLLLLDKA